MSKLNLTLIIIFTLVAVGLWFYIDSLYSQVFQSSSEYPNRFFSKYEQSLGNISEVDTNQSAKNLEVNRILSKVSLKKELIYNESSDLSTHLINEGTKLISEVDNYKAIILTRDKTKDTTLDSLHQDLYNLTLYSTSIKNFDDDIISFIRVQNASNMNQKSNEIIAVEIVRKKLNDLYQQVLDLLNTRINSISDKNVSKTNMRISLVAMYIAILSILCSRDISFNKKE